MHRVPLHPSPFLALAAFFAAQPARATYSVVATDRATQQVGGAVTSCVGAQSVATVYGPAPGHGGINAQAQQNVAGRNQGQALLNMDTPPLDIIRQITAPAFDPLAASRQYGVVDLSGRAAGFTGTSAMDYKEDRQGTFGTYAYSVQGNILTGKIVLDQAEAAFRAKGCDLAERLMFALEAGADNGQGDRRCRVDAGVPSNSASIEVDLSGAPARSYLFLQLSGTGNTSPLIRLRSMFDTWRLTHPCSADGGVVDAGGSLDGSSVDAGASSDARTGARDASDDARGASDGGAGSAGASGGSGGASGTSSAGGNGGTTSVGSTGAGGAVVGSGGTSDTTGSGTAGNAAASATTGASGSSGAGADDGGCACRAARTSRGERGGWTLMLGVTALATARRRKWFGLPRPRFGTLEHPHG